MAGAAITRNLIGPRQLAGILGTPLDELWELARNHNHYIKKFHLIEPGSDRKRVVLSTAGRLRDIQELILRRLLIPRITPSDTSHGGVRGRHIKTNATEHLDSQFFLTADIKSFYPSIRYQRVYRYMTGHLACTPDTARICTLLTTHDHHLALGLVTSPLLAEGIFAPADRRIAEACDCLGLAYTRFVDDITISGPFSLAPDSAGLLSTVSNIVSQTGFRLKPKKTQHGAANDAKVLITKLRVRHGRLDVSKSFLEEVKGQLALAKALAAGQRSASRTYWTSSQIMGRLHFVSWIRPNRWRTLFRLFREIDWNSVNKHAIEQGLSVARTRLVPLLSEQSS